MNSAIRSQFPSLERAINGRPVIYLDGPAGTQVPRAVMDAMHHYYHHSNANTHGHFVTSHETDILMDEVRQACADLLNAESPNCISLGANMTSLCFSLSHGIGRLLKAGDEVVITQLDHEANRGPWLTLQDRGILVREIRITPSGTLDEDDAREKINHRTKLVAAGYASNIFGTVNDLVLLRKLSLEAGAWLLVDAVHAAPHFSLDVQQIACDFLLCSAYKFYGPHIGILYARRGLLDRIPTDRLRVQAQQAPYSIETGTQNHAALAGVLAAVDFLAALGSGSTRRDRLTDAFGKITPYEFGLGKMLYEGLQAIPGITIHGPDFNTTGRAPTLSFTCHGRSADVVSAALGSQGIFTWAGHFYAIRATEVLDLASAGGVVRMGAVVYNTEDEIQRTIDAVKGLE